LKLDPLQHLDMRAFSLDLDYAVCREDNLALLGASSSATPLNGLRPV